MHSKYSPSKAHRWLTCTASVWAEAAFKGKESRAAAEGTLTHEVAAYCLKNSVPPEQNADDFFMAEVDTEDGLYWAYKHKDIEFYRQSFQRIELSDGMFERAERYYQLCRALETQNGAEGFVEQRVDFSESVGAEPGEAFGTVDFYTYSAVSGVINVVDLKDGWVPVEVQQNPQLMCYALGVVEECAIFGGLIDEINIMIYQGKDGGVKEQTVTLEDLKAFADKAKSAIREVEAGGVFRPSEGACRYCLASGSCRSYRDFVKNTIVEEFEDLTRERVEACSETTYLLTDDELTRAMSALAAVENWIKAIRGEVERRLLQGETVPGYKLVEGRAGPRRWTNARDVETLMKSMRLKKEDMYDMKVISPTQAEKVLSASKRRWNKLRRYITRTPGKPSVAPENDNRPVLGPVADDFGED